MNRFARIPLAGALLLLAAATAGAQSPMPPTPEEILDRAAKAQFGDRIDGLKSYRVDGTYSFPADNLVGKLLVLVSAPNKSLSRIEFPGAGVYVSAFDGTTGWSRDPSGYQTKAGAELAAIKFYAEVRGDSEWRKRYKKWTYRGEQIVDGRKAWLIELEPEGLPITIQGFDAETWLPIVMRSQTDTPEGSRIQETRWADYRAIEDPAFGRIMMAHRTTETTGDQTSVMVFEKVVANVEIDEAVFAPPEAAPEAGDQKEPGNGKGSGK